MTDKRFLLDKVEKGNAILSVKITDSVKDDDYFIMTKEIYEDDIDEIVGVLNEQQYVIDEQNQRIRKLENILKKLQFPVERVGRIFKEIGE